MEAAGTITQALLECREGDEDAFHRLVTMLYDDLRRLAHRQLRAAPWGQTLNTTGLVHEAYLRLVDQTQVSWQDRGHFMAVAARAMRFVIVDFARRRSAQKRGGGRPHLPVDEALDAAAQEAQEIVDIDLALDRLASHDERLIRVVECRFFAGLTTEETAEALEVSKRTIERDWKRAKAWLRRELAGAPGADSPDRDEGES